MIKILLIDDESQNLEALATVVERDGYTPVKASSGEVALRLLEHEAIDLVITDLKMPGMDGFALLKKIKAQQPNVAVIVITAYGTIETAVAAMREGAYDFIAKPF